MDRVSIVCAAWRAFPSDRASRLAAITSRGVPSADARRYAGEHQGEPCTKGHTAARDGCQPVDKKGKAAKQVGASKVGIERKNREKARKLVAETNEQSGVASPLKRAKQVREITEKSGVSSAAVSRMLDKKEGKKSAGFVKQMARAVPAEVEHFDHELEKIGIGGKGKAGKVARGALIAGYFAVKTAMAVTGAHGPLGAATHAASKLVGDVPGAIAYWTGADAMSMVKVLHEGTKLTGRAINAGIKILQARKGGVS